MRLTKLGGGTLFMAALTLTAAASTGNNLLYLLYSALLAALLLSVFGGRWNLRGVSAGVEPGARGFRGREFPLTIRVENRSSWTAFGLAASWGARRSALPPLPAGGRVATRLSCAAPHRGLNRLDGLVVESLFPFALIRHVRPAADAVVLALPNTAPVRSAAELSADAAPAGRPQARKGRGEELFGVRAYDQGDEARVINWKLSARTGKLLVNEYCEPGPSHVIVRAAGGAGPAAERAVEAAATACRFYSDAGASVELATPHERIGPARGLRHLDRMLEALARLGEGGTARPAPGPTDAAAGAAEDAAPWRTLTFLVLALAYSSMFLVDEINPLMLWALSPVIAAGWWVQRRGRSPLPEAVWNFLSLATVFFVAVIDRRVSGVIVADFHLVLYLLANRALHPMSPKEFRQVFLIAFLAFFLASGLTISLWYFAFFLAYVAFSVAWLERAAGVEPLDRRAVGTAAAAVLAVATAAFVVTPRVDSLRKYNPFLAAGIDKLAVNSSSLTGYTENVTLGYFGLMKKSSARVMQVKPVPPPAAQPAPPPLYVRGAAFDSFDGKRWGKTRGEFFFRLGGKKFASVGGRAYAVNRAGELQLPAKLGGGAALYDFTVYPMGLSAAFTVGTPRLIRAEDPVSFDDTGSLSFANPYGRLTHYSVRSTLEGGGLSLETAAAQRAAALAPLSGDPRVAALARKVVGDASDEKRKIQAVVDFLHSRYSYTLLGEGPGHTLEDFLFKSKRGNCEYFATAGVALLRAVGVPARLATGFLAADWNEYGKFYDVRQSEAHAWVEAFVPGKGWITVDPTPSQGAFSAALDDFSHKMARWFDAAQIEWYRRVIGYDQYVQGNTFRRLSLAFSPASAAAAARRGARVVSLLALLGAPILLWLRRGRRPARRAPTLWERAEVALRAGGVSRAPGLTPRECARELSRGAPAFAGLPRLAELHYVRAYAGRPLTGVEEAEAEGIIKGLRERP